MNTAHTTGTALETALRTLADLDLLPEAQRNLAAETAGKLSGVGLYVAVIGEFKRGKTTLINALLGEELLPTGVLPVTAIPALVRYGTRPTATIGLLDGSAVEIPINHLPAYLTEQGNPGNVKGVREASIEYPAKVLESGLVLVDTPGTGSVHLHNTQATTDFLPRVDVALLVLTVDAPLSTSEARLIEDVAQSAARIAICLNKIDRLTPDETREALNFVRPRVSALSGTSEVTVFAVSARHGGADGGIKSLQSWLQHDVADAQTSLATERGVAVATTALALADAMLQLEAAAAAKPAEEAVAARSAFLTAQSALAASVDDEATLLLAACQRATETVIDPRADEMRTALPGILLAADDAAWPDRIAAAIDAWRHDIGAALIAAMRGPVDRHTERTRELAAQFVARTGEAFGVQLPPVIDIGARVDVESVRVTLSDDPGALAMGVRQLRAHIPGVAGRRWRERARRQQADEDADRLAGRLRYATVQSVERTARQWIRETEQSTQGLSTALAGAVGRAEQAAERGDATTPDFREIRAELEAVRGLLESR
ncbi:MAG: dynamin family protein [Candidatus Dormibacteria bacterium]